MRLNAAIKEIHKKRRRTKQTKPIEAVNKSSDRIMVVRLPVVLGNYDRPTANIAAL